MRQCLLFAFVLLALAGFTLAAEPVKSGPDVGKTASAFTVRDVTGPSKGQSLCYRCAYEDRPVACVFTREVNDEVAKLVQQLDAAVAANEGKEMRAFVVLLTDDAEAGAKQLEKLAETKGIKHVPLTMFADSDGPRPYKISKDAAVTVLMWKKAKFAVNHAFGSAKLSADDVKAVVGDTSKILD